METRDSPLARITWGCRQAGPWHPGEHGEGSEESKGGRQRRRRNGCCECSFAFIVGAAVVLDVGKEWRFRRSHDDLVRVWPVHRVYAVQPAQQALHAAGIPAFARGLHHRTLLQFFGPYVPIALLVPAAKAAQAERIVRDRLVPDLRPQTEPLDSAA